MKITKERLVSVIVGILLLSAVFSFLGVYKTSELPISQRFFLWMSTISGATTIGALVIPWIFNGPLANKSIGLKIVFLSMIVSVPVVFIVALFHGSLSGGWSLSSWGEQYIRSFVISILINSAAYLSIKSAGWIPNEDSETDASESPTHKFLERLPFQYRESSLYAISSEDHYIRVHTNLGEELILMRLSDALKELSEADGLQTHRSWWVARDGIARSVSKNGKHTLILKGGTKLPVSRSFLKSVKAANIL